MYVQTHVQIRVYTHVQSRGLTHVQRCAMGTLRFVCRFGFEVSFRPVRARNSCSLLWLFVALGLLLLWLFLLWDWLSSGTCWVVAGFVVAAMFCGFETGSFFFGDEPDFSLSSSPNGASNSCENKTIFCRTATNLPRREKKQAQSVSFTQTSSIDS